MRSIVKKAQFGAVFAAVMLSLSATAFAKDMTYEGDVLSVDVKAGTFIVKATEPGEVLEKAFLVGPKSTIFVEGELRLLGELVKGDHVVITYDPVADLTK